MRFKPRAESKLSTRNSQPVLHPPQFACRDQFTDCVFYPHGYTGMLTCSMPLTQVHTYPHTHTHTHTPTHTPTHTHTHTPPPPPPHTLSSFSSGTNVVVRIPVPKTTVSASHEPLGPGQTTELRLQDKTYIWKVKKAEGGSELLLILKV